MEYDRINSFQYWYSAHCKRCVPSELLLMPKLKVNYWQFIPLEALSSHISWNLTTALTKQTKTQVRLLSLCPLGRPASHTALPSLLNTPMLELTSDLWPLAVFLAPTKKIAKLHLHGILYMYIYASYISKICLKY